MATWRVNPVVSRELRQRVRSGRSAFVLTGYLALLVTLTVAIAWGLDRRNEQTGSADGVGATLFGSVLFGILGLVCFIVPAVAAASVAGERERLTLVPLQITLLTPGQIVRGKLVASTVFTGLLLVASLPLLAVAYVLGGVTVAQIVGGLFFVMATALFLGLLAVWTSAFLPRVQRATVVSYGFVAMLVLGTLAAYAVQHAVTVSPQNDDDTPWESLLFLAPNPFVVTADALGHVDGPGGSPFTPAQEALRRRDERRSGAASGWVGASVSGDFRVVTGSGPVFARGVDAFPQRDQARETDITDRGPIWVWTFGWWTVLGSAAYAHACRRLRMPSRSGVRP